MSIKNIKQLLRGWRTWHGQTVCDSMWLKRLGLGAFVGLSSDFRLATKGHNYTSF
jgi:hypothetical protein